MVIDGNVSFDMDLVMSTGSKGRLVIFVEVYTLVTGFSSGRKLFVFGLRAHAGIAVTS